MHRLFVRIWNELDIDEVKKHLLKAGELSANCENCQHLGIDFSMQKTCPNCKTEFKFIGFRKKSNPAEMISAIRRIKEKRPDLTVVDCEDIDRAMGKSKAQELFGR
ncbi:MAG: hypothetical protein KKB82_00400 [Candidatus Omnitrophica bacterium]|nr:hypothetical protein [Candidatus Omnitrophota bacterium]MBU1924362.1 hypothetical protein [Candidatus Omnitrophota bacterium]